MTAAPGVRWRPRRRVGAAERRQDRDFAGLFLRAEASPVYRRFCRRVYGIDLCQTNVLDRPQIELLEEGLDLCPQERALDLGCGLGTLTEHLADGTGARLLGLDRCAPAVRAARRRTATKRRRLDFRWVDLRDLPELVPDLTGEGPWDALVAVDSLYFLDDLDAAVSAFPRLLGPGGRGVAVGSELLPERGADRRQPPEAEIPAHTRLARALDRHGLRYEARDVTDREVEVWRRVLEAARELEGGFEAEGNLDLLRVRVAEAERALAWVQEGRVRRYLYRFERP